MKVVQVVVSKNLISKHLNVLKTSFCLLLGNLNYRNKQRGQITDPRGFESVVIHFLLLVSCAVCDIERSRVMYQG